MKPEVPSTECKTEVLQGGEDALDALRCRSLFAKEPRIIGLFCGKDKASCGFLPPCSTHAHTHEEGTKREGARFLGSLFTSLRTLGRQYKALQYLAECCSAF